MPGTQDRRTGDDSQVNCAQVFAGLGVVIVINVVLLGVGLVCMHMLRKR